MNLILKLRTGIVCAFVALGMGAGANAAVIVDGGDDSVAIAIMDLTATSSQGTATFDVVFVNSSFSALQAAGGAPLYDGLLPGNSEVWAVAVDEAIQDAFDTWNAGIQPDVTMAGPDSVSARTKLHIPYVAAIFQAEVENGGPESGFWSPGTNGFTQSQTETLIYASLTVVPEPGTGLLLGLGLLALGLGRSHRVRA